ncbi:hypothetical protein B5S32_g2017 [[Candida] boidinii]|nr:hypothetical protein B5S32_g2017 [[Candida] boidinii]
MNINTIDKDSMDTTNSSNINSIGDTPKLVKPSTPLHPDADVEVANSIENEIPSNLANELDLDDDEDEDDGDFNISNSNSNSKNVIAATENAFNSIKFDDDGDIIADVDNKINSYENDGLEDADDDDDEINDDELEDITNGDVLAPIKSIDPLQDMDYIDNKSLKGDENEDEDDELISIDNDGRNSETSMPNNSIFDPNNLLDIDLNTRLKNPPINPFGSNKKMISSNPIRIKRVSSQQQQNQQQLQNDSNSKNNTIFNNSGFNRDRRLSLPQQGRLIDYLDTQLLEIQRKFIKHLSLKEDEEKNQSVDSNSATSSTSTPTPTPTSTNQETNITEFNNISKLISSLYNVVNMIWFSIFQIKNVPCIYHNNLNVYSSVIDTTTTNINPSMNSHGEQIVELQIIDPKSLFGQTNYLIKIMGDFIDYLSKYDIENFDQIIDILKFLAAIDNIISILIDQEGEPEKDQEFKEEEDTDESIDIQELRNKINSVKIVNNTEKIRMESIITRTKLLIINKFDVFKNKSISDFNLNLKNEIINNKRKLNSNINNDNDNDNTNNLDQQLKNGRNNLSHIFSEYEVLIGEVYEGIIDRTSI